MMQTVPRDYSLIAPVYDKVFHRFLNEGHKELGQLLRKKRTTSNVRVLEVGVGSGLTLDYLPSAVEYHGIDINKKMLTQAELKAARFRRKKISLSIMDAHKLSFKSGSFDIVMAASVLSAVDDPLIVMREMIRVAKKGGQIAIITNVREESTSSQIIKRFDPFTKKFLGFRTDMDNKVFTAFKDIELVESKQVNNILGFPLSTFMVFHKK